MKTRLDASLKIAQLQSWRIAGWWKISSRTEAQWKELREQGDDLNYYEELISKGERASVQVFDSLHLIQLVEQRGSKSSCTPSASRVVELLRPSYGCVPQRARCILSFLDPFDSRSGSPFSRERNFSTGSDFESYTCQLGGGLRVTRAIRTSLAI